MTSELSTPSRRTIAKGAAWAVPSVAVAAAAPSLAASPTCDEPGAWHDGLALSSGCVVNVINVAASSGFQICNQGQCVIPAGTQFTEPIYVYRSDFLTNAGAVGVVEAYDTYLSLAGAAGSLFEDFTRPLLWSSVTSGTIDGREARSSTRTITLTRPIAAGECTGYGYVLTPGVSRRIHHRFEHAGSGKQSDLDPSGLIGQC